MEVEDFSSINLNDFYDFLMSTISGEANLNLELEQNFEILNSTQPGSCRL